MVPNRSTTLQGGGLTLMSLLGRLREKDVKLGGGGEVRVDLGIWEILRPTKIKIHCMKFSRSKTLC